MRISSQIIQALLIIFLVAGGLYLAKAFLVPITFAGLLAMLLTPLSSRLEKKGLNKAIAAGICVLLFVSVFAVIVALLSWQVAGIVHDANQVVAQLNKVPGIIENYVTKNLGIPAEQQHQIMKDQGTAMPKIAMVAGSAASLMGSALLAVIYIFLFIYFRSHLEAFILKMVPAGEKERAKKIMVSGGDVAQKYIAGLGMMIGVLWIMYGIGFSIIGIRHALFFAVLCGLLEIMPYIGNLTGCLITAVMAFTQGGSSMALWVFAVYGVVQFTQTYLLEPLIVGAKVSINPLFTILVIILGEKIWGIPGMIMAIPILGIVKIVCDNIPRLEPLGFLIGEVKHKQKKMKISVSDK